MFHGTLMRTVVVFHWLRGRTLTSYSWPFSSENPGAILKDIPAHVTVDRFSNTWFLLRGVSVELKTSESTVSQHASLLSDHTPMSRMQH